VTPTMQNSINTSVHHAKLGKPPRMADIMLLTKAMIHASYAHKSAEAWPAGRGGLTKPMEMVASANGSPMMRPTENEDRPLCP
jgi:hypothetical protein